QRQAGEVAALREVGAVDPLLGVGAAGQVLDLEVRGAAHVAVDREAALAAQIGGEERGQARGVVRAADRLVAARAAVEERARDGGARLAGREPDARAERPRAALPAGDRDQAVRLIVIEQPL